MLHKVLARLARRILTVRYPNSLAILNRLRGLTRLALLILAMIIAIPVAPIEPDMARLLAKLLLIGIVGLTGWAAMITLNITSDIYLRRFRIDTEDNLLARKHVTQVRVLLRTVDVLVVVVTVAIALMTFEPVRQYGVSLFASAGVAGIVAGLAARPVLTNLLAGVQLAMTQPIRIKDAVIVENEWGTIEEITSTYVVVRLWDWRSMIVPLSYFIEKPFQNWTRESSALIGAHPCRLPCAGRHHPRQAQGDRQSLEELGRQRGQLASHRRQGEHHRVALPDERALRRPGLRPALRGARAAHRFPAKAPPGGPATPAFGGCRIRRPEREDREDQGCAGSRRRRAALAPAMLQRMLPLFSQRGYPA